MNTNAEYIILGAGPAGLQLAYFFDKNGRDYLVLDKGDKPGNFFEAMPRHHKLIRMRKVAFTIILEEQLIRIAQQRIPVPSQV